jgi:hypothetical protein
MSDFPLGRGEFEDYPWTRNIRHHDPRTDTAEYRHSRAKMHELVDSTSDFLYGDEPFEDHHAGGLWLKDDVGWFMVRNLAGIEWSAQFCADPKKVDQLRINARRLYAAFPDAVAALGIRDLLDTPITTPDDVASWTDSICNASVPLPRPLHTGVIPPRAGVHHYPAPVMEIEHFKYDDFDLWHVDEHTREIVAVTPVAPPGSGDDRTRAFFAAPAVLEPTTIPGAQFALRADTTTLEEPWDGILAGDHPFSRAAFARQSRHGEARP